MQKKIIKEILKSCFNFFGFELQRLPDVKRRDPFYIQRTILRNLNQAIIFDIGAYIGEITEKYKNLFPNSVIYAFEPFEESCDKIRKVNAKYNGIQVFRLAFSNTQGREKLNINPDNSSNSFFLPDDLAIDFFQKKPSIASIEVETETIDNFCQKYAVPRINILKVDVEGAELRVFQGAKNMLDQHSIDLIYTEVMFISHYHNGALFYQIWDFLANFNYVLLSIYQTKQTAKGQLRWGNAIFLSPEIHKNLLNGKYDA